MTMPTHQPSQVTGPANGETAGCDVKTLWEKWDLGN